MTVFFECSLPWQWRPGYHVGRSMVRAWTGPFAWGWLRVSFQEFVETDYRWTNAYSRSL